MQPTLLCSSPMDYIFGQDNLKQFIWVHARVVYILIFEKRMTHYVYPEASK